MKKVMLLVLLIIASSCNLNIYQEVREERTTVLSEKKQEPSEWDIFIEALIRVESEGKADAVGKTNDVGILQITPIYVKDVNRILGEERYTLAERTDIEKSLEMYAINDPSVKPSYSSTPCSSISVEEFLEDFSHYTKVEEEKQFVKAKQLLDEFRIEYGSIEKRNKSCTSTDMVEEGFIQGYTSNEASLWWHPMGRRVFFVRGEGAFEITDKPKEEAHV